MNDVHVTEETSEEGEIQRQGEVPEGRTSLQEGPPRASEQKKKRDQSHVGGGAAERGDRAHLRAPAHSEPATVHHGVQAMAGLHRGARGSSQERRGRGRGLAAHDHRWVASREAVGV